MFWAKKSSTSTSIQNDNQTNSCGMTQTCPRCGYAVEGLALICPRCREELPRGCIGNCSKCGNRSK